MRVRPRPPPVAVSLNRLAELYRVLGQYAAAESLLKRALQIRVAALGGEHPQIADSLERLAGIYASQGKNAEAKEAADRAAAIRGKVP